MTLKKLIFDIILRKILFVNFSCDTQFCIIHANVLSVTTSCRLPSVERSQVIHATFSLNLNIQILKLDITLCVLQFKQADSICFTASFIWEICTFFFLGGSSTHKAK